MLSDDLRQLVTAYVDGELSARQRKAVQRLLQQSAEARALLEQLQDDSRRLRQLSRQRVDANFSETLLDAVAGWPRPILPFKAPERIPRRIPAHVGMAISASLLIAVGLGVYLAVTSSRRQPVEVAQYPSSLKDVPPISPPTRPVTIERSSEKPLVAPMPLKEDAVARPSPAPKDAAVPVLPPARAKQPETPPAEALTTRNPKQDVFEVFKPELSLLLSLSDLQQPETARQLNDELQKDHAFRLDLLCLDNAKAFERLQTAFRARGLRLVVDPLVQARLKTGYLPDYLLYAEDMDAAELTAILKDLHGDPKVDARLRFDRVVVNRLAAADQQKLAATLGFDPRQASVSKPKTSAGNDLRKSIADKTADQVVQSLTGGGGAKSEAARPANGKLGDRIVFVLSGFSARPHPALAKDMKAYFANLKERRPGSLQILVNARDGKR